jgi:hypothetical protein
VNYFYGESPKDTKSFDIAWLKHQKRNDHHWQWWILAEDSGNFKTMEMSIDATFEMVCDWWGASRAQGNGDWQGVFGWYEENQHKMELHPNTRDLVESILKNKGWKHD